MKKKWRQVLVDNTVYDVYLQVYHAEDVQPLYRVTIRQQIDLPRITLVFQGWTVAAVHQTARAPTDTENRLRFYFVNSRLSSDAPLIEAVRVGLRKTNCD